MINCEKIAVAMSGGVDSSVAAYLLTHRYLDHELVEGEGRRYDPIGIHLNLWACFRGKSARSCCSPMDREDARRVCELLRIPFVSIDMRERFKEEVIKPFVDEYSNGRTPNPCIHCNSRIKFDAVLSWVKKELGVAKIATGHYARIEDSGRLLKGVDTAKDQSYFLFDIQKERLKEIVFPVGRFTKQEVRRIAASAHLPVAEKAESQEICFVPDGDVAGFIESYYPDYAGSAGNFVDVDGNIIGRHRGTHVFTIGQRRGLGTGFGSRRYVKEIRPSSREVVLADDKDLFARDCFVKKVRMFEDRGCTFDADVKIRYKMPATHAKITFEDDGTAHVVFDEPVRAVTPGQAAVFYDGDLVLGGGWIE